MTGMSFEAIVRDYDLRCGVERAFNTYVGSHGTWWLPDYTPDAGTFQKLTIESGVGGQVVLSHQGLGDFVIGQVTVWEPSERLAYSTTLAQTPEYPSEISVTFTPTADGCHFHFEHGGWNEGNEKDREKFRDWGLILPRFVALAESVGGS
jgi:hypothetical protein